MKALRDGAIAGLSPSAVHNHRAAWMRQLGMCGRASPTVDCPSFGGLLEGVDMYVVEMQQQIGAVRAQAERYGIQGERIIHVAATTPKSNPDCDHLSALCAKRSRTQAVPEWSGESSLHDRGRCVHKRWL